MGGGAAVLFLFQKLFSTDSKTADAIESLRAEIHGMRNDMNMTMQSGEQHEKDLKALRARCATPNALSDCGILNGLDGAAATPHGSPRRRHVHGAH